MRPETIDRVYVAFGGREQTLTSLIESTGMAKASVYVCLQELLHEGRVECVFDSRRRSVRKRFKALEYSGCRRPSFTALEEAWPARIMAGDVE